MLDYKKDTDRYRELSESEIRPSATQKLKVFPVHYSTTDYDQNRIANRYYLQEDQLGQMLSLHPLFDAETLRMRKKEKHDAQRIVLERQIEENKKRKAYERKLELESEEKAQREIDNYNLKDRRSLAQKAIDVIVHEEMDRELDKIQEHSIPQENSNSLEFKQDMQHLKSEIFRSAFDKVQSQFNNEFGKFKDIVLQKNQALIEEIEMLKDRANRIKGEKDVNELELIKLNRDILEHKSRDDEQLRKLYIALDRTNPDNFKKYQPQDEYFPFEKIIPYDDSDPFSKAKLTWVDQVPLDSEPHANPDWLKTVAQRNNYRLGRLSNIEKNLGSEFEDNPRDRLDKAMLDYVYDGPTINHLRQNARKALDLEQNIVNDLEGLVSRLRMGGK